MIAKAAALARVGGGSELAAAVLLLLGFPAMLVAALVPDLWFFAAAAAITYLADVALHHYGSPLVKLLSQIRAGVSIRFLVRQLLLVLLTSRTGSSDTLVFCLGTAAFLVFYGLQAPHAAALTLIRNRRRLPVVTRNIDLEGLRIPGAPPRTLTHRATEKMLHLDLPLVAGLIATAATGKSVFTHTGIAVTLALGALYLLVLLSHLRASRLPADSEQVLSHIDDWLREYQPRTVLYFSGSRTSAYQVNMWLETMESLRSRSLVILRERSIAAQLASTRVPVLCVPSATHLMNMDLSSVRVALYPANVGKNIHLLRVPSIQHVFIGHGDSDKIASVNPYSKAYDEVWTAGRAGRDRYALADVGVRDEDIVEVGRPQLGAIRHGGAEQAGPIPTVLYAPTWEGWTDEPGNTSLILAGENIVRQLVTATPEVRVLYKPHPFTGTRSPAAKAAHERILALLEKANAERAADPKWHERTSAGTAEQAAAACELRRITARLAQLEQVSPDDADEAEGSRDAIVDPARAGEATRLRTQGNEAYWKSQPWWQHQVATGSRPHLYDCFNVSDLLISDISSVVSDFIASGKPYAIADTAGLGTEEFKRQNTAARAATVLAPDASGVPALLASLREPGSDVLAEGRTRLKEYLLGPDEPASMTRFDEAVERLAAKADARLARPAAAGVGEKASGELPAPRGALSESVPSTG